MQRFCRSALLALLALAACDRRTPEPEPGAKKKAAITSKVGSKAKAKPKAPPTERTGEPRNFLVPFAWEASEREPLAQARSFLKEILTDNAIYMDHGPRFFSAFAAGQTPRATVVTCSDSRVHTTAFDTTPENDDFMVRNIGNQVANAEGSVEYGVEHLGTPVLLILGHTGCGAVQAALAGLSDQSAPLRKELEALRLPSPKAGATPEDAWSDAVIANVHNQVAVVLDRFGARVQSGKLTVIGAVYDFRNDLRHGAGKVSIVDVNGNSEPERMQAFLEAIGSAGSGPKKKDAKDADKEKSKLKEPPPGAKQHASTQSSQSDDAMVDALAQIPGLLVQRPHLSGSVRQKAP